MGESRHTPAFAALPVAAFVADAAGGILAVSSAWGDQLGLPVESSISRSLWECLGGALADRVRAAWAGCVAGGRLDVEGVVEAADGVERCWQLEAHRNADAEIVGVIHDVTDRWLRTKMQRRLLAWSRSLQQASTFGELVDLAEAEAKEVTGYRTFWLFIRPTPESPVARRLASSGRASAAQWEHLPEIVIAEDALALEVCESDHTVIVEDARTDPRTNKDTVARLGSRTSINVPLTFLDQNIGCFGMGSFGDEGVRLPSPLELEVVETMAQHIAVAAGRLRFLAERRQAERERQALELRMLRLKNFESLGVLAGGIAHDVNNLMTVVIGNVALARTAVCDDADADDALQHAHVAAMRTTALAEQMLAYAGHGALRRETGDLHAIASESLSLARVSVPKRTMLELRGSEDCLVAGDLTQLRQLVMNLITNAGEAIGEARDGTIGRTVNRKALDAATLADSLLEQAVPGPYVVLEIADDGCGMDADTRSRMFDPFFTTKVTGRGLGMSAALGIVRGHGGALWVDSTPGRGTMFRVALPAVNACSTKAGKAPTGMDDRVVLLAEDDDSVRDLTRLTLEGAGFEVIEARDGVEAIQLFHDHADRIGVALLDSLMPGFSGNQVLHEIRSSHPGFPVVVCSGFIKEAAPTGPERPTAMLPKPWKPGELIRVLESSLQHER